MTPTLGHLIGFALDVSGSMEASIQNASGGSESRLDSIKGALDTLLAEAERLTGTGIADESESQLYFFAYAFGLKIGNGYGDLFRLLDCKHDLELLSSGRTDELSSLVRDIVEGKAKKLQASYEPRLQYDERGVAIEVMGFSAHRLLSMSREQAERELRRALTDHIRARIGPAVVTELLKKDLTVSLSELTNRWKSLRDGISMSNDVLGGSTPMTATLKEIAERFKRERANRANPSCTLFIVSDGAATDGDPRPVASMMAADGVRIVSCFVSEQNVIEPRRLYVQYDATWPEGARFMFEMASLLPVPGPEADYLARIGWKTVTDGRMFAQINQSDLLSEFMNVVIAPIEAEHGTTNQPR